MNIQVEAVGPSRKQISIELPASEVSDAFKDALSNYQRFARIPGFRPGKAPVHLVKSRYQKEILKDLKDFLLPRGYQAAIKQEKLDVVRVIEVTDATPVEGQPYGFSVTVDVTPEFELPDYRAIRIEKKPVDVTDDAINDVIETMRNRMATYEEVPGRVSEKSDRVMISYEATVDGAPMEQLVKEHKMLAKATEIGLILDPEYSFIPEFSDALVGMKAGDRKDVDVKFEDAFVEKALAGKQAIYKVDVLKVERKKLPEVNAEFFKLMGVESEEAIRSRIREDLGRMKASEEQRRIEAEISKQLNEQTAMVLPQSEVQRETANEVFDLVQYNTSRGLDRSMIEENRDKIFDTAAKSAEERIKLRYILLKIAGKENLTVSNEELEQHIRYIAQRSHRDPAKVRAELVKKDAMDDVKRDVLARKAMTLLTKLQQPEEALAS